MNSDTQIEHWVMLPLHELTEALQHCASDAKLCIGGIVNVHEHAIMLVRNDMSIISAPMSMFKRPADGPVPDFSDFEIIDHGQTLRFGHYEASFDAVVEELMSIKACIKANVRFRRIASNKCDDCVSNDAKFDVLDDHDHVVASCCRVCLRKRLHVAGMKDELDCAAHDCYELPATGDRYCTKHGGIPIAWDQYGRWHHRDR